MGNRDNIGDMNLTRNAKVWCGWQDSLRPVFTNMPKVIIRPGQIPHKVFRSMGKSICGLFSIFFITVDLCNTLFFTAPHNLLREFAPLAFSAKGLYDIAPICFLKMTREGRVGSYLI